MSVSNKLKTLLEQNEKKITGTTSSDAGPVGKEHSHPYEVDSEGNGIAKDSDAHTHDIENWKVKEGGRTPEDNHTHTIEQEKENVKENVINEAGMFPKKAVDLNKLKSKEGFWDWDIDSAMKWGGLRKPSIDGKIADLIFWLNMATDAWEKSGFGKKK